MESGKAKVGFVLVSDVCGVRGRLSLTPGPSPMPGRGEMFVVGGAEC